MDCVLASFLLVSQGCKCGERERLGGGDPPNLDSYPLTHSVIMDHWFSCENQSHEETSLRARVLSLTWKRGHPQPSLSC